MLYSFNNNHHFNTIKNEKNKNLMLLRERYFQFHLIWTSAFFSFSFFILSFRFQFPIAFGTHADNNGIIVWTLALCNDAEHFMDRQLDGLLFSGWITRSHSVLFWFSEHWHFTWKNRARYSVLFLLFFSSLSRFYIYI